jgi:hypothetical protein
VPAQQISSIVTDALAPIELLERWRDRNVEVVAAELGAEMDPHPTRVVGRHWLGQQTGSKRPGTTSRNHAGRKPLNVQNLDE